MLKEKTAGPVPSEHQFDDLVGRDKPGLPLGEWILFNFPPNLEHIRRGEIRFYKNRNGALRNSIHTYYIVKDGKLQAKMVGNDYVLIKDYPNISNKNEYYDEIIEAKQLYQLVLVDGQFSLAKVEEPWTCILF